MLKGAIFDFDGTIVDSMFIWETFAAFTLEQAAEHYQKHYGVTLSAEEIVSGINKMVLQSYSTKVKLKYIQMQ